MDKQQELLSKLNEHFGHLLAFLGTDEIGIFFGITKKIIIEYAYEGIEILHINRGKKGKFAKLLEKTGIGNEVEITNEESRTIDNEKALTLTAIHNHPNNTGPSHNDFLFLIVHNSLQNMIIFGPVGCLYFVQNSSQDLHFRYSDKDRINCLKRRLKGAICTLVMEYMRNSFHTNDQNECLKLLAALDKTTKETMERAVVDAYFRKICAVYDFNHYAGI